MADKENSKEVTPVKLSTKASVILGILLSLALFILVGMLRGCQLQKVVNSGGSGQSSQTVMTEPSKSPTNPSIQTENPAQNSPNSGGSSSAPVESAGTENNPSSNFGEYRDGEGLLEVSEPTLGDLLSNPGMVIGKRVYLMEGAYVYRVALSVIVNGRAISAEYFCPRKTYEALSPGDSLTVTYQVGNDGCISVYSVAKG